MGVDRRQPFIYEHNIWRPCDARLWIIPLMFKPCDQIGGPAARLFRATPFGPIHVQWQADDNTIHPVVFDDVEHVIERLEIIPPDCDVAGGMRQRELRVGQCQSDPCVPQINAKPHHTRSGLHGLTLQRFERGVDLRRVGAAALGEVGLAAAATAEHLGCATH